MGSLVTSDARCTHEIKCMIAMAKLAFKKKTLVTSKFSVNIRKKLMYSTFGAYILWL
jgi:hypothetical protein